MIVWILIFCASIFFLVKSADWFTEGAEKFAISLGINQWVVGMTLVALGTSLPEFFTSFSAAMQGHTELVVDNVIGSNVANIFLVIGIAALFAKKLVIERDLIDLDLPLLAASQAILLFVIWDGSVSFADAIISLFVLAVYLLYTTKIRHGQQLHKHGKENMWKLGGIIVGSAIVLMFAAKYTIESLLNLGELLGVSASILSITALAVGTSLPELVVSVSAARRGSFEMSFGNIIGSNIFNGAGVVGLVGLFFPLVVSASVLSVGVGFLAAAVILCVFSGISRKIHSWEGMMFLLLYAMFIGKLFGAF